MAIYYKLWFMCLIHPRHILINGYVAYIMEHVSNPTPNIRAYTYRYGHIAKGMTMGRG